jgi:signal transduction histidine kinase
MQAETVREMDLAEILGAASRELCRVRDLDAAGSALERWTSVVVGSRTTVALLLFGDDGRLRNAFGSPAAAARSTARRRMVLRTDTPDVHDVGPKGSSAVFPLSVGDASIGVMEVSARRGSLRPVLGSLEVLANQVAVVAEHLGREHRWSSQMASMTRVLELGRQLTESKTDEHVVRSAINCVRDVLHVPVAGWLAHETDGGTLWSFAGSKGVGSRQRELLVQGDLERGQILARFRDATGSSEASMIGSKRATLVLSDAGGDAPPILSPLAAMIDEALGRIEAERLITLRYRQLDLGLAITAHEIRGPILGARTALASVRSDEEWSEADRDLLSRTQRELEDLAGMADGLLRWASTAHSLRARTLDLVPLIRAAVAGIGDPDAQRVLVDAGEPVRSKVNAPQLRGAVANLVRNALAYAPSDGTVRVSVSSIDDRSIIDVQDEGLGVPREMQASIFDPFARGPAAVATPGSGLGLFIARRVVEAHGGSLSLLDGSPTTFRILLPAAHGRREQPSAS